MKAKVGSSARAIPKGRRRGAGRGVRPRESCMGRRRVCGGFREIMDGERDYEA